MPNYYYHPLGDLAKAFIDGTASNSEWPHTYNENESKSNGINDLDWGSGSAIPPKIPIYSMTDGTIYNITADHSDNKRGFVVSIKTDRLDGASKPICIQYIKLSGLSNALAELVGCTKGALSLDEFAGVSINSNSQIPIKMGEQIGYTNDWYSNHSNFQTTFNYEGQNESTSSDDSPHVKKEDLTEEFALESNNTGSKAEYIVKCNGNLVGTNNGMVRTQDGSSDLYPVYPFISYMVCQQTPQYLSGVSQNGGISIGKIDQVINGDKMNQDALKCYITQILGKEWMGKRPTSIEELNNNLGIRRATAVCSQELHFTTYGLFPGASYGKLLRAKMIGENHSGNNMKEWFENLNESQFAGKTGWMNKTFNTESDLRFSQLVYDNIKYPDIYGIEEFSGSEQLKDAILYACRQIPIYNLHPIAYAPHSFVVNFNTKKNIDEHTSTSGSGNYLLYRQESADMKYFNSNVLI